MYKFLKNLSENDPFWDNEQLFDRNVCFNGYMDETIDINRCKNWYAQNKIFFGKGLNNFFKKWKEDNAAEKDLFISDLQKFLEI